LSTTPPLNQPETAPTSTAPIAVTVDATSQNPTPASKASIHGHIVFFFVVLIALAVAFELRTVLELIYVSALFAVILIPAVGWVTSHKIGRYRPSRTVAILVLLLTVVAALTTFLVITLPPVLHDIKDFATDLPARLPTIIAKIKKLPLADKFGLDAMAARAENAVAAFGSYLLFNIPLWLSKGLDIVTGIILCVYFMLEGENAYQWFLSLLPSYQRGRLDGTLQKAEVRMSKWLFGQGLLMLILGTLSTTVFGLLGVRYFVLLGVLMGLFNLIPVAGGVITILLAMGVAALDSWSKMAFVALFYFIYVNVENSFLTPRIMKSSVDLMGLTVIISLLIGTSLAGIVGALVSVPTAVLVSCLASEYLVHRD
jgi:predicted PurR-regulated permease PerM